MSYNNIEIQFNHSASPRFTFVLKEAKASKTFKQNGKVYSVRYTREDHADIHKIITRLKSFIHKRVFIDDEEQPWNEVFAYLWCYELRSNAYDQDMYCHGDAQVFPAINPWGCVHVKMPLSVESPWFRYGRFDSDGKTFIFNKKMIAHYFKANTKEFRFCPALNIDKMNQVLAKLPDTVNPSLNHDWQYVGPVITALVTLISTDDTAVTHPCGVCLSSPEARNKVFKQLTGKEFGCQGI